MAALPYRVQQCLVSLLGALLFLPLYLFWGGVFSFSYSIYDSAWAWAFGLTACWCQILAILFSFMRPRIAALWMIGNTVMSILLAGGHLNALAHGRVASAAPLEIWLRSGAGYVKAGCIFCVPPLLMAYFLIRNHQTESFAELTGSTQM